MNPRKGSSRAHAPATGNERQGGFQMRTHSKSQAVKWFLFTALLMLPIIGSVVIFSWPWLLAPLILYLSASTLTFWLFRRDKIFAQEGRRRIPESILHLGEVLGGWPGALLGQSTFRHKTRKFSYQFLLWASVAVHQLIWALALVYLR